MPHTSVPPRASRRRPVAALDTPAARRVVVALNVLVLVAALTPFAVWEGYGPARFGEVDLGQMPDVVEFETGDPLAASSGEGASNWVAQLPFDLAPTTTVTLVFSVGSRGMDAEEAERLRVHDVEDRGGDGLTDTMMLVVADRATREVALLSLPRDLWMHHRGHRINATHNLEGLQAFVDDVARSVGLPIHHLVELNFGAFARMVDAVGGVAMHVDRPLADVPAVLYVPEAGCWHFDGAAALAWSRGRHTLTLDGDGDWVTDRTASDFGRIERQQLLLRVLWDQVRSPATLASLPQVLGVARGGLVVDEGLGVQQVRDLLQAFSEVAAGGVEGYTLPTTGQWIDGNAAQVVVQDAAAPILTRLRTWPPAVDEPAPGAADLDGHGTSAGLDVLAAPATMARSGAPTCTRAEARVLPDPGAPLWGVARSRDGAVSTTADDDRESDDPDAPDDADAPGPSDQPGGDPTEPGEDPSPRPGEPTEDPDGDPDPSPTESDPEDDDGGIRLPLPRGGGGDDGSEG